MTRHEWANRPGRSSRWISPTRRFAIYLRDGFQCLYCQAGIEAVAHLTLDHLMPRKHGGSDEETNLVTACPSCNSARQHLPWKDFASQAARRRITRQRRRPVNLPLAASLMRGPYR